MQDAPMTISINKRESKFDGKIEVLLKSENAIQIWGATRDFFLVLFIAVRNLSGVYIGGLLAMWLPAILRNRHKNRELKSRIFFF